GDAAASERLTPASEADAPSADQPAEIEARTVAEEGPAAVERPEYSAGALSDMPPPAAQDASPADIETGEVRAEAAEASTSDAAGAEPGEAGEGASETAEAKTGAENGEDDEAAEEAVESVGGADALEEVPDR